jgi:hypothetical protein
VLLLLAQKKNWKEKSPFAGKNYRKTNLVLLENTDFEKSHTHNSLNYSLFLLFNHYDPKRNIVEAPSMQYE